jgi:hypothetical protein
MNKDDNNSEILVGRRLQTYVIGILFNPNSNAVNIAEKQIQKTKSTALQKKLNTI